MRMLWKVLVAVMLLVSFPGVVMREEGVGYRSVKESEYDLRIYQADPPMKNLLGDIDGDGLVDIPMRHSSGGIYIKFGKNLEFGRTPC